MTNSGNRYLELDALRGFAVMGILLMNILAFNMPEMAYINPKVYGGTEGADLWAWFLGFILVDGKMRGLFSLLFGASMMLIIARADATGQNPAKIHYSRMIWLALFGLAHFFFIWWGDILFLYAIVGCIAFLFRRWEADRLIKWAVGIYIAGTAIFLLAMGSLFWLEAAATAPDASAEAITEYKEAVGAIDPSAKDIADELALYRGDYWSILSTKFSEMWFKPFVNPTMLIFETLPLMMIGMACLKNGFLLGQKDSGIYRKWAIWGITFGILAYAILGWASFRSDFNAITVINANMAWSLPPRLVMTLSYASALILLIQRFEGSALITRIACAGRAAFTNYLGTSILMTFIFYGWGLGYYGEIGRAQSYLFVLGACALMLLWSKPWLMRYRYGPLEWLWRSLARGQIQPLRIAA